MIQPLFEVVDLTKRYGSNTVVDQLSFSIAPGECLGVIGPNGAGKTTTIRMCLGLTSPDAGRISYFPNGAATGKALSLRMPQDALAIKEQLGIVSQFDSLDPDFSCAENLLVFGRYFGLKDAVIKARIPKLLEFAALTHKADAKLSELSGGMKRRLSLARALVNEPQLLLLDEPTTGLDPQARHLMWERLQRLVQQGKSILLTTHFMDEAERLCNRLLVLDHGKKMTEGAPRELIAQNLEPDVVEVYGAGALALMDSPLKSLAARIEVSGETVFFYTSDAKGLLAALGDYPELRTLHRPANLVGSDASVLRALPDGNRAGDDELVTASRIILEVGRQVGPLGVRREGRLLDRDRPGNRAVMIGQADLGTAGVAERAGITREVHRRDADRQERGRLPVLADAEGPVGGHVPLAPGMTETEEIRAVPVEEVTLDQGADLADRRVHLRLDAEAGLLGMQADMRLGVVGACPEARNVEGIAGIVVEVIDHVALDVTIDDHLGHRRTSMTLPVAYPLGWPMVFQSVVLDPAGLRWSTPSIIVRN